MTIQIFSKLPDNLKSIVNLQHFVRDLKIYLNHSSGVISFISEGRDVTITIYEPISGSILSVMQRAI